MKYTAIGNKKYLNEFVGHRSHSQFQQSWEWGDFQKRAGCKVLRIGIEDGKGMIAAMTLIKKPLPLGFFYFYCPRGPVVSLEIRSKKFEVMGMLFDVIKDIARRERIIFLRFEPTFDISEIEPQVTKTRDVQPSRTMMIDLRNSEAEIFDKMHPKTRYNIRLAEKHGIAVREIGPDITAEEFEKFWNLMSATVIRDKFRLHDKEYYRQMFSSPKADSSEGADNATGAAVCPPMRKISDHNKPPLPAGSLDLKIKLYLAEYRGNVIAANIVVFFGESVSYIHGASANEYRNLMAPHLLQWHAIKLAKVQGYSYYDFCGIDDGKWPGVTRFKKGFGGQEYIYPGTYDLVYGRTRYDIYRAARSIRRIF